MFSEKTKTKCRNGDMVIRAKLPKLRISTQTSQVNLRNVLIKAHLNETEHIKKGANISSSNRRTGKLYLALCLNLSFTFNLWRWAIDAWQFSINCSNEWKYRFQKLNLYNASIQTISTCGYVFLIRVFFCCVSCR